MQCNALYFVLIRGKWDNKFVQRILDNKYIFCLEPTLRFVSLSAENLQMIMVLYRP